MKSRILDKIYEKYLSEELYSEPGKILFVLPSRRSARYSKERIKNILRTQKKEGFLPQLFTPNEFLEKITGLTLLSQTDLIYYLYLCYKEIHKVNYDTFSDFAKWGLILLSDFNDVLTAHPGNDDYHKKIFTHLREIKEIENWSLNRETLTENQKKYIHLMSTFYEIFKRYNNLLLEQNYAYSGLLYHQAVQIIRNKELFKANKFINRLEKIIFIGLNALTSAEEEIIKKLYEEGKAEFIMDYDPYYVQNKEHEAGYFIRKNLSNFPDKYTVNNSSSFDKKKEIEITAASHDLEEVLYIKHCLTEIKKSDPELKNTAILLNRPEALPIILSAIPEEIEFNVSMEYPIRLTDAFQFLSGIVKILQEIPKENNSDTVKIYYKQYEGLLMNSFFKMYLKDMHNIDEKSTLKIIKDIHQKNKIQILLTSDDEKKQKNSLEINQDKINSILKKIVGEKENTEIIKNIRKFYEEYYEFLLSKDNDTRKKIHIHIIQEILSGLKKIEEKINTDDYNVFQNINDLNALILQIMSGTSLSLKGEPFKGLQIIGMLESRLLDFDNIIIPFMNEGIFPPDHKKSSFMPYLDFRKYYNLPTHYEYDAIFAYNLYRCLQTPDKICISYNNSKNKNDKGIYQFRGEESRYIQQIKYELSQDIKNIIVKEKTIQIQDSGFNLQNNIEIKKSEEILDIMKKITYTPTSITTYLNCSLQFYFKYILKLKEKEEASEYLEANIEGNIFHSVMQQLYSTENNKYEILDKSNIIQSNKLEEIIKHNVIDKLIDEEINKMNLESKGKVLIQKEILKDDIRRFIRKEKEFSEKYKVKIIYVEKYNNKNFNYEKETVIINHDIKISGIPDRIDYLVDKNLFRIIDYKSSFTKSDKMMFEELYEMMENENNEEKNNKYNKLIQLLTYIYYAVQTDKNIKGKITGAILPLRDTDYDNKKTFDSYNKYIKSSEMNSEEINIKCFESIDEIEKLFKKLFNNIIFNKQKNFVQTSNSDTCRYCSYNSICKIKDL